MKFKSGPNACPDFFNGKSAYLWDWDCQVESIYKICRAKVDVSTVHCNSYRELNNTIECKFTSTS